MKKIKINFSDFWDSFDKTDNFITDALKKNFQIEISDNPDFVFCATFGRKHLKYKCAKIFYTGENLCPDFNLVDYALGVHEITFNDRYLQLPHYVLYPHATELALKKHQNVKDIANPANRKFCNYVISNALSDPSRGEMISKLSEYKALDSGGRYNNNVGGPVADKIEFEKSYKFSLCFENSSHPGYTTEKIVEGFAGLTVPIYWGNPLIAKEFNEEAFINCHNFNSFEEVIEEIKRIDADDEAYEKMISAPIIKGDEHTAKTFLSKNYLSDYLYTICSQEPEKAIRRNRIYQGMRYEQQAVFHEKIDRLLYLPRRGFYFLQNKFKK